MVQHHHEQLFKTSGVQIRIQNPDSDSNPDKWRIPVLASDIGYNAWPNRVFYGNNVGP